METSSTTAHHQKLMAAGASSQMEEVVSCNSKPRQQLPAAAEKQAAVGRKPRPHPDKEIKCPRCDSIETKFCYYNNYSMSQPRYFCKDCRRYWTQGGSLRNVPIGGGCRKNKRSSASSSSTSASASSPSSALAPASKINKLVPEPMVPLSCTDFPNVLPTFSSTGFELPRDHLSLAFASSSSNPAVTLPPGGTFLDILRGGVLDGNHQSNAYYGPTGGNGMVMMPPSTFGVGARLNLMMQQYGLGGTADHAIGGATATTQQGVVNGIMDAGEEGSGDVKAMMGLQWPSQIGGGGVGSAGGQLQVGAQQQQGTVTNNNVMMDNTTNNNGPSSDCYWNNGAASSANPWQGLINSSSLI